MVPKGYVGITLYPFIFLKRKSLKQDSLLINHEKIHLRQQRELFILPFFILYGIEFLFRLIQYRDWKLAYFAISFEREAYTNQHDLNFLEKRQFWNFIYYF
jgi:hypothetical protein